ncbi:MAG: hypothetical protein ABI402_02085 [Ferruginibacter sp.]
MKIILIKRALVIIGIISILLIFFFLFSEKDVDPNTSDAPFISGQSSVS